MRVEKALLTSLEEQRGNVRFNDGIALILTIAAIAKLEPVLFEEIYRTPKASIKNRLIAKIENSGILRKLNCLELVDNNYVTTEILQKGVYLINDISNFAQLADIVVEKIQSKQSKFSGAISCPPALISIIKELLGDVRDLRIYDGAAGLCGITGALRSRDMKLEEINAESWRLGNLLLILRDLEPTLERNDSLGNNGPSVQADLVVTQPPWGFRFSPQQREGLQTANYLQFGHGQKIPASAGDALWIQQALFHMKDTGRAVIILPQGWLFRGGYDAKLRAYLLEYDLIETLIGLPGLLFANTSIPAVILVLNKDKTEKRKGIVQMVDASGMGEPGKNNKVLSAEEQGLIVDLCQGKMQDHDCYKAILLPEIYQNDNDLNIQQYFAQKKEIELPNFAKELEKLNKATARFVTAQEQLNSLLNQKKGACNFY